MEYYKKHYNELKMKQHNLKSFNGFAKPTENVGHLFSFYFHKVKSRTDVVLAYNGLRLCVCLPLRNASINDKLYGQIAQNRCYTLATVD